MGNPFLAEALGGWRTMSMGPWTCLCSNYQGTVAVTEILWLSRCWVLQGMQLPCPSPLHLFSSWDSPGSAGGKCPALPTSDPALGQTCPGKLGLFQSAPQKSPIVGGVWEERKAAKPSLLAAVGVLTLLSLVLTLHTALVCFFKLFYFLYYAQTFSFPHRDGRCQGLTLGSHAHKGAAAPSFLIFLNSWTVLAQADFSGYFQEKIVCDFNKALIEKSSWLESLSAPHPLLPPLLFWVGL